MTVAVSWRLCVWRSRVQGSESAPALVQCCFAPFVASLEDGMTQNSRGKEEGRGQECVWRSQHVNQSFPVLLCYMPTSADARTRS
mmetsp:Transcript_20139/g.34688  ORF Transcript_20139/g.34688 Transcript_20139/m.34688 type:complete len:85 (-) Transcript_20139:13-267(-)